jgi:Protein of unknown function (DUF2892)
MTQNVGNLDRVLRVILGLAMLSFALMSGYQYAWIGWMGIIPLLTAAMSSCPLYSIFGINSCPVKRT